MKNLTNLIMFTGGVVIGSVVTWALVKTKYEQIAQEEIDSVKEMFSSEKKKSTTTEGEPEVEESNTMNMYETILSNSGYADNPDDYTLKEAEDMDEPYVISPEEFGEDDEYETETLTYYKDGVLTDDLDNPIEDVERMVGTDSLTRFGEFEDDSVYVKNDRLKTYFEILLDYGNYRDLYREEK